MILKYLLVTSDKNEIFSEKVRTCVSLNLYSQLMNIYKRLILSPMIHIVTVLIFLVIKDI